MKELTKMNLHFHTKGIALLISGLFVVLTLVVIPSTLAAGKPVIPDEGQAGQGMPREPLIPSTITINSGTVAVGEIFTASIDLDVPAANNLTAITIDVQYDPTVLASDGTCLVNTTDFTLNICNRSDGDGQPPDVFSYTALNVTGVNGVINLGKIPFTGLSAGTSDLTIVVRTFDDGSGESPNVVNGSVQVDEPTAIHLHNFSIAAAEKESGVLMVLLAVLAGVSFISIFQLEEIRKWRRHS
jgi:hypothetical protein